MNIIDDVPTARNDTDALPAASTTETGNVITGTGTTSGSAGADTLGADGAAVTGLRAGTSGAFSNAGNTVTGQFGTLTLGANGEYTYTRTGNTGSGQTDTFSYQLTDGDGDTSIATLVISIPDRPVSITGLTPATPDGQGGDVTVNEEHLPAGTNPADAQLTPGRHVHHFRTRWRSDSVNWRNHRDLRRRLHRCFDCHTVWQHAEYHWL